jgi:aminoglycoside phosphotransferase (APT) family kinase protein
MFLLDLYLGFTTIFGEIILSVYDQQAREQITQLKGIINSKAALFLWEQAIQSKCDKAPVWVHGDFASGNLLIKDGKLAGVIDFGCMAVGDPACDLVISWTLLREKFLGSY